MYAPNHLEPTEPEVPEIILDHLYLIKAFLVILKSICSPLGPLVYFFNSCFYFPKWYLASNW